MRLRRTILILFSLIMLLGCQPKHPVEMRISASSSSELAAWRDKNLRHMPEDLQADFKFAVAVMDPSEGMSEEESKRAWLQIDNASVREFILSAYERSHRRLSSRIRQAQRDFEKADIFLRTAALQSYERMKVKGRADELAGEVTELRKRLQRLEASKAKFIKRYPETR